MAVETDLHISKKKHKSPGKIVDNQMVETQEMHCQGCGRFLGFQAIIYGIVKIKCRFCKQWNTIDIRPDA